MELKDLRNACFRVAENTLGDQADAQIKSKEEHTNRLYKIAFDQYEISKDLGCTVPMLVRAVDYLCQAHAIPPMRDSCTNLI
jgi:hypothetical protein